MWSHDVSHDSVEIRPNLPVPNLVENEHLQIWLLFEAELNAAIYTLFLFLNTQRKTRNILMLVCLLFRLLSLVLFWQLTREWGVLWKGAFYKTPGFPCRPTILPSVGLHAGYCFFLWRKGYCFFCVYILFVFCRLKFPRNPCNPRDNSRVSIEL
jgi:hypothetical protein